MQNGSCPDTERCLGPSEVGAFRAKMDALVEEVSDGIAQGDPRDRLAAEIRFKDCIHISTGGSPSYPDHLIELFQRKSIEAIYDQLVERRGGR